MKNNNNYGWVSIHRKFFYNKLWLSEQFTKSQAWIDLFANANHIDGSFFVRGNEIKIKRGQIGWSELTMSARWKWSRNKVRRFLSWLENERQVEQQKTKITTIITILNYDKYQSMEQQTIHQKDSRRYTNNNDNNDNKIGEETSPLKKENSLEYLKNLSLEEINWFVDKYNCTKEQVEAKAEAVVLYCQSKKKKFNNYKAVLQSWLLKDFGKKTPNYLKFKK